MVRILILLIGAATRANIALAFVVPQIIPTATPQQPQFWQHSTAIILFSSSSVEAENMSSSHDSSGTTTATPCSLNLCSVKNARDLASVKESPILPNRVYRTGKLSDATSEDIHTLLDIKGIKTVIDLRSPTELKEDEGLHREEVFGNFSSIRWKEGKRTRFIFGDGNHKHFNAKIEDKGLNAQVVVPHHASPAEGSTQHKSVEENVSTTGKERHFVSLMNEYKYVRGVARKLTKREVLKLVLQSPGALFSRRVRKALKNVFLDEINDGGLPLLNELMLRMGAPGISYCLELVSDREKHPIIFHCTAGKDRTGIITALILSLVGVPDFAIVEDYALSANVYAEMNDHTAMVGALSQRNLDPKTFLGAPPQVMQDTLDSIRETYGSVEGYCDWIGFGPELREKLKTALTT